MIHINVGAILSVHVYDKSVSAHYTWKDEITEIKGWFGVVKRKAKPAGFYAAWTSYNEPLTADEILSNYLGLGGDVIVDTDLKTVWNKPKVVIRSLGGKYVEENESHFNTYEEAIDYANKITAEFPHITLIK